MNALKRKALKQRITDLAQEQFDGLLRDPIEALSASQSQEIPCPLTRNRLSCRHVSNFLEDDPARRDSKQLDTMEGWKKKNGRVRTQSSTRAGLLLSLTKRVKGFLKHGHSGT